jgi:PAS domain S-box-containing protein
MPIDYRANQAGAGKVSHEAELYRLVVESVSDYAIFALGPTGLVLSWNPGAQRIKGYTAAEIIGQPFTKFYPPEAIASGFPQYELEVAAREGRFEDEGWRVRKDGSRFWANVVISAVKDAKGRVLGYAKVTRDLTARREAEEQARQLAAEQAARAEAQRRGEELARLNEQLQEQAAELEMQAEELQAFVDQQNEANERLQEAVASANSARQAAQRLRMISGAVILIVVDADKADAMTLRRLFRSHHLANALYMAHDGAEALRILRSRELPTERRVVLLDLDMPRMTGIDFLQQVRGDPELKDTTIVVLTTSDNGRERTQTQKLNVAGYLAKPVAFSAFFDLMVSLNKHWSLVELPMGERVTEGASLE